MIELILIREAARRLGVSDTAVHKAIKAERIAAPLDEDNDPRNGRRRLRWPAVRDQWEANTDASRRYHVGGTGQSKQRLAYAKNPYEDALAAFGEPEPSKKAPAEPPKQPQEPVEPADEGADDPSGPSLADSRAKRERWLAEKARMEAEEMAGTLVRAETVKNQAFRLARGARDALMTLPDRLAPILASQTDLHEVHKTLLDDIERICERISQDAANFAEQ